MRLRTLLLALATLSLFAVSVPPVAHAGPDQVSIMMDDDQLLYRGDRRATASLVFMKSLGVDVVRVTVLWKTVAEGADPTDKEIARLKTQKERDKAKAQRRRFKPKDPRTYPTRNWDRYDNLVKSAAQHGMRVFFSVTGPGPHYAHKKAPSSQAKNAGTFKPYPTRFRDFVEAVGRRYSGNTKDENGIRKKLPRVDVWSIWNEPNQPGWLSPQWERRDGQLVPASPALYRKLYHAGVEGLARAGHTLASDVILLGETAPLGSDSQGPRSPLRPVPFLRELLCVAPNGTQYAGADAARRDCDDFARKGPLQATGFAHHPYTKKELPTKPPAKPADEITIANVGALGPVLDTLAAQSGGKLPASLPVFLTEYGYESNPPDTRNGIPLMRQAEYNQIGEYLAYSDPRVVATTQFLLRDAAPVKRYPKGSRLYWFTYQSGLLTNGGRAKPAAYSYALPLLLFASGDGQFSFWGQLRFRPNGAPADVAHVIWRPTPKAPWQAVGEPVTTSFRGFFSGTAAIPAPGGEYSAVYFDPATSKPTNLALPTKLK